MNALNNRRFANLSRLFFIAAACALLLLSLSSGAWAENIALYSTVINSSGTYGGLPNFPATNVIDGKGVDNENYGTVAQDIFGNNTPGSASYWLTQDGQGAGSFFVLDLHNAEPITQFRIANTHNSGYGDRGTLEFNVLASNHIDGSNNLVSPVTLISNQSIPYPTSGTNIPFEGYLPASGPDFGSYRYVEFLTVSAQNNNGGLNEFQVIAAAPEPSSVILCGLGAAGLLVAARRRRKA